MDRLHDARERKDVNRNGKSCLGKEIRDSCRLDMKEGGNLYYFGYDRISVVPCGLSSVRIEF